MSVHICSYVEKTRSMFTKLLTSYLWDLALQLIFTCLALSVLLGGFVFTMSVYHSH